MRRSEITRIELVWPGKYNEEGTRREPSREPLPLRAVERYGGGAASTPNRLVWGDNLPAMASLLPELAGKVDLIYVDPPFATGNDFLFRGPLGEDETASDPGLVHGTAYRDSWGADPAPYLQMMYDRLPLLRDLLAETGSLYVHLDATVVHYVKALLDEVFGPECFQRQIIWRIGWVSGYKSAARNWIRNHDVLLFYVKIPGQFTFNKEYLPYPPGYTRRGGEAPRGKGFPIEDVWNANPAEFALTGEQSLDSIQIKSFSGEKSGYATQKNESLLSRIVRASSNPGDLVADFFCGSGTTLVAAEKLGRRWVGCDRSRFAIQSARKRLLDLPDHRPFELLTLGAGERRCWQGTVFADPTAYRTHLLRCYGAEPTGAPLLHGTRSGATVTIAGVEGPLSNDTLRAALEECASAGWRELHALAWEWQDADTEAMRAAAERLGVRLRLVTIPREVMESRDAAGFAALAEVDAELIQSEPLSAALRLRGLTVPDMERFPEDVRARAGQWSDYVDSWAVEWDYRGQAFTPDWVAYRTRRQRRLSLESPPHRYPAPGAYRVRVKVVDILGAETWHTLRVGVGPG